MPCPTGVDLTKIVASSSCAEKVPENNMAGTSITRGRELIALVAAVAVAGGLLAGKGLENGAAHRRAPGNKFFLFAMSCGAVSNTKGPGGDAVMPFPNSNIDRAALGKILEEGASIFL